MTLHKNIPLGSHHVPYNFTYADAATREAASGLVTADIGKFARQLDNNSIWMLTSTSPTWVAVGGIGGGDPDGYVSAVQGADGYVAFFTGGDTISGESSLYWDSASDTLELDGYVVPQVDNVHDLGTYDKRWHDIWLGPASLRIASKTTDGGRPNKIFYFDVDQDGTFRILDESTTVAEFSASGGASFPSGGGTAALEQQVTWIQEGLDGYSGGDTSALEQQVTWIQEGLDGYGKYASTSFTSQTSVNIIHNFGTYPVVQILDNTGTVFAPESITHNTLNDFTVIFTGSTSGTILTRA